jgi:enoyl-CoA hydratase
VEEKPVENGETTADASLRAAADATPGVILGQDNAAGLVTLNRPAALNALDTDMRAAMAAAFPPWARDPQIYAVVIGSATDRAFCAGGDVRELAEWGKIRRADAIKSLAAEYALNWQLECFMKPTVSLIDGVVVGSGVGISLYGTHRVAAERYRFAMPETGIGLFPDVGVAWAFARLPDEIGMYLGLTGRTIGRADAYRLGLATHCIPRSRFEEVRAGLADADPVDDLLDARHEDPGPGELEPWRKVIARCFSGDSVEDILGRLKSETGVAATWAHTVVEELKTRSPTSLKITHRHIRAAGALDLRATLAQDFRLGCRCLEAHDFFEGVRAQLIDRDRAPKWEPATLAEVSDPMVERYFASLGPDELELPSRAEMQSVGR